VRRRITSDSAQSNLVSMWPDRRRESDLGHLEGATAHITYDVGTCKPGARNLQAARLWIEVRADVERATARRGQRTANFIDT
jgi:hypothetical protein